MLLRFIVLMASMAGSLAAAYVLAGHLRSSRSAAERWFITGLLCHLLPFATWYLISLLRAFDGVWAPVATLASSGMVVAVAGRKSPWRERLRQDTKKLLGCFRPGPQALLHLYFVAAAASFALLVSVAQVLFYPTWSWDCVWYHQAQTRYILQERSILYWVDTHIGYINGYPRLVEATAAYASAVLGSEWLDDAAQLGWAFTGAAGVAAWCRRFAVTRTTSLALGLAWILCPAVFLQIHTTHADVAAGALFIGLAYFLTAPRFSPRTLTVAALCAGGLLSTKISGLLLVALMTPLFVLQAVRVWKRQDPFRLRAGQLVAIAASLIVGGTQPVHNWIQAQNPFFPARVTVPFTGKTLPGTIDEAQVANGRAFFQKPGSFSFMLTQWYRTPGVPFPDIRERPFGVTFNLVTLPLLALALLCLVVRRPFRVAALVFVVGASLMQPAPWWGRFVLGIPAVAFVGAGVVLRLLEKRARALQLLLLAVLGFTAVADLALHFVGYRQTPSLDPRLRLRDEDRLRAEMYWMLPRGVLRARDAELGAGDVWAYDESVHFLGEHWNTGTTSLARFVASGNRPRADYVADIQRSGAKWVTVAGGSVAERALVEDLRATLVLRRLYGGSAIYRLR